MTVLNRNSTLLIVEDDPAYLDNMELILQMEGFRVLTATDGNAALALMEHDIPDLILCDIMMPGMDGYTLFELLKQDERFADLSFIFVTALADRSDMRKGMSAGADDYLTKPFTAEELITAVMARLKRQRKTLPKSDGTFNNDVMVLRRLITSREREVLLLVSSGATSKEISTALNISVRTVDSHRTSLMNKLNASNAAALAYWANIAKQM